MAAVLTAVSSVTCSHKPPGVVTAASAAKLAVNGNPVLLKTDVESATVTCTVPTDTNTGQKTCTKVVAVSAGPSAKLTVANTPVLLETLAGTTDGVVASIPPGTATLSATAGQTVLTAL